MPRLSRKPSAFVLLAAALAVLLAVPGAGRAGGLAGLVSHRAAYEIRLHQSRESVGPTAARGLMAYEFTDACERWIVDNRIVLDVIYGEETPVRIDWSFTSWESKDGREYGYNMVHRRNGQVEEELKGTARLDAGGRGTAEFTGEAAKNVPLPAGTLFPTSHLIASLKAAAAGDKTFARPMFDGGSLDNPYDVNVYFVPAKTATAPVREVLAKGGFKPGLPLWRYQAAFFSRAAGEGTPAFELEVDYRADGVAERIVQSFSDFSILMTPAKLQKLKGGC